MIPNLERAPQNGEFADKPGNYEVIYTLRNQIIDPGDVVDVEIYITGYGVIESAKLVYIPSVDLFDPVESEIRTGLEMKDSKITYGGQIRKIDKIGMFLSFYGLKYPKWKKSSYFFDLNDAPAPMISTEYRASEAPIHLILKTDRHTKPGNYSLNLGFTYFNGTEWKGSTSLVTFSVSNVLQRKEGLIVWIGVIAAIVSIVASFVDIFR